MTPLDLETRCRAILADEYGTSLGEQILAQGHLDLLDKLRAKIAEKRVLAERYHNAAFVLVDEIESILGESK